MVYTPAPRLRGVRNSLRAAHEGLVDDVLPELRREADACVDALAAARARQSDRDAVRAETRANLRARRDRGLA